MVRYTYLDPNGTALLTDELDGRYTANEVIDILAARLCAYEETGIEPGELTGLLRSPVYIAACVLNGATITHERAIEIAKAEVEGRLLVLPCKPGKMAYIVCDLRGTEFHSKAEVIGPYHVCDVTPRGFWIQKKPGADKHFCRWYEVGKTIFWSKQKAEAARDAIITEDINVLTKKEDA